MRKIHMKGAWPWLVAAGAVFVPATVLGALTIPNSFTAGTPIKASEMNENFAAIKEAVDKKQEAPARGVYTTSFGGQTGYAAINCSTNCTVFSSYNSSGGNTSVTRHGTGHYTVSFAGLGTWCSLPAICLADGVVQVTAYGDDSRYCKLMGWSTRNPSAEGTATVTCHAANGAASDSNFMISLTR